MRKNLLCVTMALAVSAALLAGCTETAAEQVPQTNEQTEAGTTETVQESSSKASTEEAAATENVLEDGVYSAKFTTDGSMFHVNEAYDDRGTLTVKNGEMTIHITMPSKNIVNLFSGSAEDAQKDGAELIEPTTDTVNYEDGTTEIVHGFDVPVKSLDTDFDLALIGEKGVWYDHKVSVSNPQ